MNTTKPAQPITIPDSSRRISLNEIIKQQTLERGLLPLKLEPELLLKRISQGGFSGEFLADAFFSAYRRFNFNYALFDLTKLDSEGFRLFHQILHIRHVSGWSDDHLYEIEQRIKTQQIALLVDKELDFFDLPGGVGCSSTQSPVVVE